MCLKASLFPITVINVTCKTKSFFDINTLFQTRQTASRLLSHIKVKKKKKSLLQLVQSCLFIFFASMDTSYKQLCHP